MATTPQDMIDQSPRAGSPVSPGPGPASPSPTATRAVTPTPDQQPPKLKGRRRLLQNLQRISSSPSLTRRGRSSSATNTIYRRDGKASLSCVSLSTSSYTPCLGNLGAGSSQMYGGLGGPNNGFAPVSPMDNATTVHPDMDTDSPRVRLVGADSFTSMPQSKSVPLPFELRPTSRGALPVEAWPLPVSKPAIDFWGDMPYELRMRILRFLPPRDILRCAAVSKAWYHMCYDGQLWSSIDMPEHYSEIPSTGLVKLIISGGPFVRSIDVRGCSHLPDRWLVDGERISEACRNVVNFSVEGCHIDKKSVHSFLLRNSRLRSINVPGLPSVSNSAVKIIAQSCPMLEMLNVSWCPNVDTSGLKRIVQSCPRLRDLRAAEVGGFSDEEFMYELFTHNTLETGLAVHRSYGSKS